MNSSHADAIATIASILADDGDSLTTVDLRDLDAHRLRSLRDDAGRHGDLDMVATIDMVLSRG